MSSFFYFHWFTYASHKFIILNKDLSTHISLKCYFVISFLFSLVHFLKHHLKLPCSSTYYDDFLLPRSLFLPHNLSPVKESAVWIFPYFSLVRITYTTKVCIYIYGLLHLKLGKTQQEASHVSFQFVTLNCLFTIFQVNLFTKMYSHLLGQFWYILLC
jgi:hypothetical protein